MPLERNENRKLYQLPNISIVDIVTNGLIFKIYCKLNCSCFADFPQIEPPIIQDHLFSSTFYTIFELLSPGNIECHFPYHAASLMSVCHLLHYNFRRISTLSTKFLYLSEAGFERNKMIIHYSVVYILIITELRIYTGVLQRFRNISERSIIYRRAPNRTHV